MQAILLIAALTLVGCIEPANAKRVLEDAGYSNVEIIGYDIFSCSDDDTLHTGFTATGPTGRPVRGTVCSGLFFKNSTIRLK